MKDVLHYCERKYETLALFTDKPHLYESLGFRVLQESVFKKKWNLPAHTQNKGFRLLDHQSQQDIRIIHRLLETRVPVSKVMGMRPEKGVFCFDEGSRDLFYCKDLDLIASFGTEGSRLHLYDLVGPKLYPLQEVVRHLGMPLEEIWIYFSPDQLDVEAQAEPFILEDSLLMIKGPFDLQGAPFMWPRSARC